jgi:hypothetical protein
MEASERGKARPPWSTRSGVPISCRAGIIGRLQVQPAPGTQPRMAVPPESRMRSLFLNVRLSKRVGKEKSSWQLRVGRKADRKRLNTEGTEKRAQSRTEMEFGKTSNERTRG